MRLSRHSKIGKNSYEFELSRKEMVESQIIRYGEIKDKNVIQAMLKVPRHLFMPEALKYEAYGDYPLPIGEGQTISQPYMVAAMTEALELKITDRVLEIGTGSGYQAAILAEIVGEVYTIERIESIAQQAKKNLANQGYTNIKIKTGDGTLGWEEFAPYDGIIVTAGAPSVPEILFKQLKEGGRLVIPIGDRFSQDLVLVRKQNGKPMQKSLLGCMFVSLVGKYGWRNGG